MSDWPRLDRVLLATVGVLAVAGCGRSEPPDPAPAAGANAEGDAPTAAPATVRVRGFVRLAADSDDLPGYELADIGRDASRPGVPPECPPARASDTRPLSLSPERGIGGILVTATGDPALFREMPTEPSSFPLAIRDCRLQPTLMVAMVGDTIPLTNHSPVAFITRFSTDPINEAIAPNRVRQLEVIRPGVHRVDCTMVAGCGLTDVVVLAHRVATVTDATGAFELDVPAGAPVELHAWHPLLRRREGTATLPAADAVAGETRTLEVTLRIPPPGEANVPVAPAPDPASGPVDFH
ncbi:MAG: hypothetical protein R3B40_26320 [Polyangiales bacterium]